MNIPAELSPEVAAWMRVQMSIAAARAVEPLKEEISKVDEWANGLFVALRDVLPVLLLESPALTREIEPQWRKAAEEFDRVEQHGHQANDEESLELLEARKMLYRLLSVCGLWMQSEVNSVSTRNLKVRRA